MCWNIKKTESIIHIELFTKRGDKMINGVAIISACMFAGFFIGSVIGDLVGVGSNVGGVGFAMLLLLLVTDYLRRKDKLSKNISDGIMFWQSLYIPVVIAMTATQNVVQAVSAGSFAIVCGMIVVILGFVIVWGSSFLPKPKDANVEDANCAERS